MEQLSPSTVLRMLTIGGRMVTISGLIATLACSKAEIAPPDDALQRTLTVDASGAPLSALVLELDGVASITARNGRVAERLDGGVLTVLVLLDEPGVVTLDATLADVGGTATGVVLDASDAADNPVADVGSITLRVEP